MHATRRARQHITTALLLATVGVVSAAALLGPAPVASAVGDASLSAPRWAAVVPGIEFARVEAARYCRQGSTGIGVVRMDPSRCRLEPFHETEYPGAAAVGVQGWMDRLKAPIVFNAGLYDEARRHLGTLQRDGKRLESVKHTRWLALLVSGPKAPDLPAAAILDLGVAAERGWAGQYRNAVQCMMLFDGSGEARVRRSENVAPLTLLAADEAGRLLVFVTEGGFTLWESALLLREAGLGLVRAMALDGGRQASLAVEGGGVSYRSYAPSGGSVSAGEVLRAATTLPAVVAVRAGAASN